MADLFKMAENVDVSMFSAKPKEISCKNWKYVKNTPITLQDFLDLLPDAIVDPKNGKNVILGSTVLKGFHDVI